MARRSQPNRISWPLTPELVKRMDEMFQTLFDDSNNGSMSVRANQITDTLLPAHGGTGLASYTIGDLLYASASQTLAKLTDVATGNALISGGLATAPSWGKIGLTTHVTGTLPVANGGTGFSTYAVGDILYASGAATLSKLADVAAGAYLRSGGVTTAPVWSTLILPNAASVGDLLQATTANTLTVLNAVAAGSYLRSGGVSTASVWSTVKIPNAAATGDLWQGTSTSNMTALASVAAGSYLRSGGVTTASVWSTVTIPNAASAGDLWQGSAASTISALASVAAGSYLRSAGVTTANVWSTLTLPNAAAQGDVFISTAANVMTSLAKNASATRYLSNTGTTNNPAWAQINLPDGVTGLLPDANLSTNIPLLNGTNAFTGTITLTNNSANAFQVKGSSSNSVSFLFQNTFAGSNSYSFFVSGGGPAANGTYGIFDNGAGAARWTIDNTGIVNALGAMTNTGMGAASAGTTVVVTGGANEFRPLLSSSRFKTNITDYDVTRDVGAALRGIQLKRFDYTDQQIVTRGMDLQGRPTTSSRLSIGGKNNVGVLAEDVFAVLPEAVNVDDQGLPYSLRYDVFAMLLLRAYQQLADTLHVPRGNPPTNPGQP